MTCPLTLHSFIGYFVILGLSLVSWKTKKQPTMYRSSAEAEYYLMATTSCELNWLKPLLKSLDVRYSCPMCLYCDISSFPHWCDIDFHEHTKHIEVDCHYVQD